MNTIVIVTHPGIADALKATATTILTTLPCEIITVDCPPDSDTDNLLVSVTASLKDISGDIIVFSDVFGATPHNLANSIVNTVSQNASLISGINLPMLMRTINYIDLPLADLCSKGMNGGKEGIKQ